MRRPFFRVRQKTACTMPQLRVPWDKTACSARQGPEICWRRDDLRVARQRNCVQHGRLREPCAGGLRQGPTTAPSASMPLPPAAHVPAPRQPNRSSVTHMPELCARDQRRHIFFSAFPARNPRSRPASAESQPSCRLASAEPHTQPNARDGWTRPYVSGLIAKRKAWQSGGRHARFGSRG